MHRRQVDIIMCVQETKFWKGWNVRNRRLVKFAYCGVDGKRRSKMMLSEDYARNIKEVKRVSEKLLLIKLETEKEVM